MSLPTDPLALAVEALGDFANRLAAKGWGGIESTLVRINEDEARALCSLIDTLRAAPVPSVVSEEVVEALWEALKHQCCADPDNAKRIVMMGPDDLRAALGAIGGPEGSIGSSRASRAATQARCPQAQRSDGKEK